jgi:molybdenum cofactor cytidylyltransferase
MAIIEKSCDENNCNIEAVILAAGLSSRAGTFKMELPFDGKFLLLKVIEALITFCSRIIVVGGHNIDKIFHMTQQYPRVQVVNNRQYKSGMFSSVKTGIAEVTASWFLFTPGDFPFIDTSTCRKLLEARERYPEKDIFIPVHQGRKGHPILVKRSIVPNILAEPDDSNLKIFIQRHGFVRVPVDDEGILIDIDSMEDYRKWSR